MAKGSGNAASSCLPRVVAAVRGSFCLVYLFLIGFPLPSNKNRQRSRCRLSTPEIPLFAPVTAPIHLGLRLTQHNVSAIPCNTVQLLCQGFLSDIAKHQPV